MTTYAGIARFGAHIATGYRFDGNSRLELSADLTGISDGKDGTVSFWLRMETSNVKFNRVLVNDTGVQVATRRSDHRLYIELQDTGGSDVLVISTTQAITQVNGWYHVMASWDGSATTSHLYVNGADDQIVVTHNTNDIDYTGTAWAIGNDVGGGGANVLKGQIADLWFDDSYIDLSDAAERAKFYSAQGHPVYLGPGGEIPTGSRPLVYMGGPHSTWHTNRGTGGGFTQNGSFTDPADNPEFASATFTASGETPNRADGFAGTSSFAALGEHIQPNSASFTGVSSFDATSRATRDRAAEFSGTPSFTAAGDYDASPFSGRTATFSGTSSFTATRTFDLELVSTTVTEVSSETTTPSFNMPDERPDGDLYVLELSIDGDATVDTVPSHFDLVATRASSDPSGARIASYEWYGGESGSHEPGSYSITLSDAEEVAAIVYRFRHFDNTNPIDVVETAFDLAVNQTAPDATTTVAKTIVLRGLAIDAEDPSATPATEDAKGITDDTDMDGGEIGYGFSNEAGPDPAGATGTAAFTHGSAKGATITIAITPGTDGNGRNTSMSPSGTSSFSATATLNHGRSATFTGAGQHVLTDDDGNPLTTEGDGTTIQLVGFDGSFALTRDADLDGNADGQQGIFSAWVQFDDDDSQFQILYRNNNSKVIVWRLNNNQIQVGLTDEDNNTVLQIRSTSTYTIATGLFHILCAWDASTPSIELYIDDTDEGGTVVENGGTIDYTEDEHYIGGNLGTSPTNEFKGCMGQLYLNLAETIDITVEANRRLFYSADGFPVDLGADGSTPTGTAPIVFLAGPEATWHTNRGTGGGFTENGALEDCGTTGTDVLVVDDISFTAYGTALDLLAASFSGTSSIDFSGSLEIFQRPAEFFGTSSFTANGEHVLGGVTAAEFTGVSSFTATGDHTASATTARPTSGIVGRSARESPVPYRSGFPTRRVARFGSDRLYGDGMLDDDGPVLQRVEKKRKRKRGRRPKPQYMFQVAIALPPSRRVFLQFDREADVFAADGAAGLRAEVARVMAADRQRRVEQAVWEQRNREAELAFQSEWDDAQAQASQRYQETVAADDAARRQAEAEERRMMERTEAIRAARRADEEAIARFLIEMLEQEDAA